MNSEDQIAERLRQAQDAVAQGAIGAKPQSDTWPTDEIRVWIEGRQENKVLIRAEWVEYLM